MALFDLGVQLRHALIVEGHLTTHQHIEDDAKAPDIDLGPRVLLGLQQLGGGKVEAAAVSLELPILLWREEVAQAEIDDLDVASFANQNVLNLEVPVHDAVSVAIVQGAGYLSTKFSSLLFLQFAMRNDVVQHLAAIDKFEEHVPVIVGPDNISQPANMRMV